MSVTLDIRLKRANKVYHEGVSTVTASVASLANATFSTVVNLVLNCVTN